MRQTVLEGLEEVGFAVKPLSPNTNLLQVECRKEASLHDDNMEKLYPLAERVAWLDLGGTAVGDEGLAVVGKMKHLTRLYLQNTAVTDAGLRHLEGLGQLEYLNLYGTNVTDAGLKHLVPLKELSRLFLWQTDVSKEGARRLKHDLPAVDINLGEAL